MHLKAYTASQNSWLPVTRNMPYTSASVPQRSRNMTGIYLGLESNSRPPRTKSAIPPLARGRGISQRVRTPAEDRRYKLVEYLRIKEEKRGFTGGIKKNCKSAVTGNSHRENPEEGHIMLKRTWGPGKLIDPNNLDDFIRPNARCFTAVSNSGVTRSEKLISPSLSASRNHMSYNKDEWISLAECYRQICKDNDVSLSSLLPGRRVQHQPDTRRDNTGFTVRSYVNPHKAQILAEFQEPGKLWPNSSQKSAHADRYRPGLGDPSSATAAPNRKSRPNRTRASEPPGGGQDCYEHLVLPDIVGDLVSGPTSGGLHYRIAPLTESISSQPREEYTLSSSKVTSSDGQRQGSADKKSASRSPALVVLPDRGGSEEGEGEESEREGGVGGEDRDEEDAGEDNNMNQVMISGDVLNSSLEVRPRVRLTTSNSGADIMLGLETDEGKSAEVEIDSLETDELQPEGEEGVMVLGDIPKGRVRKTSIVEKLSKSKESEMIALSLMESAGQRQREFEKLINEHQELVQEISRTPSAENIVQSEAGRDP